MQSRVSAWIMPATGDCAPERMLVAVRAMAPVAGRPPNMGEKMLATPWPINSTLGLWRSLVMRSETTADMSDLIGPSIATVKGGRSRQWLRMVVNQGACRWDKELIVNTAQG